MFIICKTNTSISKRCQIVTKTVIFDLLTYKSIDAIYLVILTDYLANIRTFYGEKTFFIYIIYWIRSDLMYGQPTDSNVYSNILSLIQSGA